ncbi:MerR family transcriptional regulator [Bacillus gobiensis]|uniref:MerR family transcriptional regulator n=1 Tax=Bacillus gobiensis TaxID=1441095 RepID=UPI003D242671
MPYKVNDAGYRFYGIKELERLQQILFYRELDFPLKKIKHILDGKSDRVTILSNQKELLLAQIRKTKRLVQTIDETIDHAMKGEKMKKSDMFKGFKSENEWKEALQEQNTHLVENYGYDLIEDQDIDVDSLNESAIEAQQFMEHMADALNNGVTHDDAEVRSLISKHIRFLNEHSQNIEAEDFVAQTKFFLTDDFHRQMIESNQTGLSYFLYVAAESFAAAK